jgi:hypothetical protein
MAATGGRRSGSAGRRPRRKPPAETRGARVERQVRAILADRDPASLLETIRGHLDEMPRDQVDFQRDVHAVAGARLAELERGRRG